MAKEENHFREQSVLIARSKCCVLTWEDFIGRSQVMLCFICHNGQSLLLHLIKSIPPDFLVGR